MSDCVQREPQHRASAKALLRNAFITAAPTECPLSILNSIKSKLAAKQDVVQTVCLRAANALKLNFNSCLQYRTRVRTSKLMGQRVLSSLHLLLLLFSSRLVCTSLR